MLTDSLKLINETAQSVFERFQRSFVTAVLLYFAAPNESLFLFNSIGNYLSAATSYTMSLLRLNANGSDNISAIITVCIAWIGLQLVFFAHDLCLFVLSVALPTTSVSIRWLPDSENEEEQYIQRFTYKYFDHLMTMTDFTTLFDLYKVKITNSADFGNQQARTFGFLPNIPWMRERILLSIVAFFYFGERKHELLLVGSILILIIWSMVQQRRISALGAYSNLLAAKSTALELINGRIDKQLTEESRTTEIGNVRSSSSLNVFLTIGGANLHYSQSYFYVSVGNIWRRQFHSPRDLI